MGKLTKIIIKDSNTLILQEEGHIGDEIDLLAINQCDTSILSKKIAEGTDQEYNRRLKEFESRKALEISAAVAKAQAEYTSEIATLQEKLKQSEAAITAKVVALYQEEINKLQLALQAKDAELVQHQNLEEVNKQLAISDQKNAYDNKIADLEKELNDMKLKKSAQNVKRIGEELEHWCDNEYTMYAQSGFLNCTWQKDNTVVKNEDDVKGSKADYIFHVYATDTKKPSELLTSVVCEMKSEAPNSVNKKKNADYFAKLEKDRIKKNCEYALLVSELEWDQANDVPIRKVAEYDKMYVVRPQYFVAFLSIVNSLGMKYKELLLAANEEREQFRESQEILDDFNNMKKNLLDKPIDNLNKEITKVKNNAEKIKNMSDEIMASTDKMANTLLENIKIKIEDFNIQKITKKINKLIEK